MQKVLPLALALGLSVTPAFAQDQTVVAPLPPGQAAGVTTAPMIATNTLVWVGVSAAVIAAVAIPLASSSHSSSTTTTTKGH
jgi:hypothetical protein